MPKFTLIAEHTDGYGNVTGHKVTHEFDVEYLPEVLENMDLFLHGVGFVPEGVLDYVAEKTYYGLDPDFGDHGGGSLPEDYPDLEKSPHYFDTERNK